MLSIANDLRSRKNFIYFSFKVRIFKIFLSEETTQSIDYSVALFMLTEAKLFRETIFKKTF